jgi:hypothetical protein
MSTPIPTSVQGSLSVNVSSKSTPISAASIETSISQIGLQIQLPYQPGYGSGQCDVQYSEVIPLSANTPQSIVLSGDPSRKDAFGHQLSMARVKLLLVRNLSATEAAAVVVGGGSHALIPAQEPIAGGGLWLTADFGSAGVVAVSAGSTDTIQLDPGTNAATVQVVVLGCSQ